MKKVICSCCGKYTPDTEKGNISFGEDPYPHDKGYGMCWPCAKDDVERFMDRRIPQLANALNAENQKKFLAMSREMQETVVTASLEEEGLWGDWGPVELWKPIKLVLKE